MTITQTTLPSLPFESELRALLATFGPGHPAETHVLQALRDILLLRDPTDADLDAITDDDLEPVRHLTERLALAAAHNMVGNHDHYTRLSAAARAMKRCVDMVESHRRFARVVGAIKAGEHGEAVRDFASAAARVLSDAEPST